MAHADNIRSDNKFMRLAVLLEPEITRMLEQQSSRTYGHDDVQIDAQRGIVTYFSRGHLIWEARAEVIGSYLPDFGLWRWWWTGRIVSDARAKCSMDLAYSEAQRHHIGALTNEHPRIAIEDDAQLLSNVCAHLARADGLYRLQDDEKITFYALFDTGKVKRASAMPTKGVAASLRPGAMPGAAAVPSQSMRPAPVPMMPVGERVITPAPTAADARGVPRQAVPVPRQERELQASAYDGLGGLGSMAPPANLRQEVPRPTQMPKPLTEFAREPSTNQAMTSPQMHGPQTVHGMHGGHPAMSQAPQPYHPAMTQAPAAHHALTQVPGAHAPIAPREARYSVPDLDDPFALPNDRASATYVARETTSTAMLTIAPNAMGAPGGAPRAPPPIREPSREVVIPVVQVAAAAVGPAMPNGFHQALIVVNVDITEGKARFTAMVCASDETGDLTLVDTTRELIEATGRMIAEDARSGNGRWRRLTVKLSRTQRGAAIDVSVK